MTDEKKKVINPFEEKCVDCVTDIWEIISQKKIPECASATYIKIEKYKDDSIY